MPLCSGLLSTLTPSSSCPVGVPLEIRDRMAIPTPNVNAHSSPDSAPWHLQGATSLSQATNKCQKPGRAGPRLTPCWGQGVGLGASPTFSFSDASELQCDCKRVREPRHHKGAEAMVSKAPTPTLHAHTAPRIKELSLTMQDLWGWNFPVSQRRLPGGMIIIRTFLYKDEESDLEPRGRSA